MRETMAALLGAVVLVASAGFATAASATTSNTPLDAKHEAAVECQHSGGRFSPVAGVCEFPGQ